ncbi:MAG: very short patch repair endonuclease [Acutalibacter sp.]|nr:very short patch repair endonuclease [Acutalibacter sp.]
MGRYTDEQTHRIMSAIHSRDTDIELRLRKALWHKGYRYRKNVKTLPGKPDIVFTKYKLAIFCDAEFWHGKDWDTLKSKLLRGKNPEYWIPKIERTRERDTKAERELQSMGWTVLRFWREEILHDLPQCIQAVEDTLFEIRLSFYETENVDTYEDGL